MKPLLTISLLLLALAACSSAGPPVADDELLGDTGKADGARGGSYRDLEEALAGDDLDRWFDLKRMLAREFDEVCGDTFCEGDYTNLQSLRIRCSVSDATGALRSCMWLFAGSFEQVRPATGSFEVHSRFFRCPLPFTGAPRALLDALLGPGDGGPLHRKPPGSERTVYESLGGCFE